MNSGGHISYWAPLFKSEGPAQVAVIVLTFLLNVLGPAVPFEDWKDIGEFKCLKKCYFNLIFEVLDYDNMCHLDSLKMFRSPLPAKGNLALIWEKVKILNLESLHRCTITI